jgi:hypothetical protein
MNMQNQNQHGGARDGSGRKPKATSLENGLEKNIMQPTQPTFETLSDELSALPVLLIQAADEGDAAKILALKNRQSQLSLEIEAAKIPALQRELAALESKTAPLNSEVERFCAAHAIAARAASEAPKHTNCTTRKRL